MTGNLARWRLAVLATAGALLATACGLTGSATQSLEQADRAGSGLSAAGSAGQLTGTGGTAGTAGSSAAATGAGGVQAGTTGAARTSGGSAANSAAATGSTGAAAPGAAATAGGCGSCETLGIDTVHHVIHIGIHAPVTGAAPVPVRAFQIGPELFWENHTVFGYKVVANYLDDQYNPDVARRVCEQLSREDFLVIGGAGTDQIQACATDPALAQTHTPYLSEGVTTNGLTGLPDYFALTQTYAEQAPEVYTNASNVYPTESQGKWAIITTQSPNFDDVTNAMENVLRQHGRQFTVIRTNKYGSQQDAITAVTQAHNYGATTAFVDLAPNFWLYMVGAAAQQLWTPAWVGPGVTMGEDLVAAPACREQQNIKASFLSPFFALDHQPPGFTAENNPSADPDPPDRDLEMDIYGLSEVIYYALLRVGSIANLTRDNFIAALTHLTAAHGSQLDVYPTVTMNGGHFGGTGAWSEQLDCTKQEYVTVGSSYLTS